MRSLTRSLFPAKTLKFLLSTCASSLPELAPDGKVRKSLAAQWSDLSPQLIVLFRLAFLAIPKKPFLTRIRSLRESSIRPSPAGTFTFSVPIIDTSVHAKTRVSISASPEAVSGVVAGVERIWTAKEWQGCGVASFILDTLAQTAIYGTPILPMQRSDLIAFSQPTPMGARLFARWTGTSKFLVFNEG